MKSLIKAAVAGVGVVAASATVFVMSHGEPTEQQHSVDATQGMVVVIDQETGQLRAPTTDEAANYASQKPASAKETKVVRRADGSESMKLNDSFTIYSTVERDDNGNWIRRCSLDHDHALDVQKAVK